LALWILLSVGAGAFTSLFITGLFKLSNYFTRYKPRYRRNAVEDSNSTKGSTTYRRQSQPDTNSTPVTPLPMIGPVIPLMTMIGTLMKTLTKRNVSSQKMPATYEVSSEPKSGSRSGSVYPTVIVSLRVLAWKLSPSMMRTMSAHAAP